MMTQENKNIHAPVNAPQTSPKADPEAGLRAAVGPYNIVLLSLERLQGCPKCKILKDKLRQAQIPFLTMEVTEATGKGLEAYGIHAYPVLVLQTAKELERLNYMQALAWLQTDHWKEYCDPELVERNARFQEAIAALGKVHPKDRDILPVPFEEDVSQRTEDLLDRIFQIRREPVVGEVDGEVDIPSPTQAELEEMVANWPSEEETQVMCDDEDSVSETE